MKSPVTRILVADADEDTRTLYLQTATLAGWDLVAVSDGRDALVNALIHPPALVLTELALPLLDGFSLCEILRRDPATTDIPILVITAETRATPLTRARQMGADRVLVKPIAPETVVEEMRRLIAGPRMACGNDASATRRRPESVAPSADATSLNRRYRSKSFPRRTTTTPPAAPPPQICPECDARLAYERSHIGGVNEHQREQWDDYQCFTCGTFQYRHRTRKLRRVS